MNRSAHLPFHLPSSASARPGLIAEIVSPRISGVSPTGAQRSRVGPSYLRLVGRSRGSSGTPSFTPSLPVIGS